MTLLIETEYVQLNVVFDYYPGQDYNVSGVTIQPPDSPEITIKHVYVGHSNGQMDVYNSLSRNELDNIEKYCLEYMETA